MGCSGLNQHLYTNLHVIPSPECSCGEGIETPYHFFTECKQFIDERENLIRSVTSLCNFDLDNLLFGDSALPHKDNLLIFDAVHKYLEDTKRFTECV